jgi:hypothetical protein
VGTITRFEDIEAWQTARQLANMIYDLTESGSFERDYGLRNQIPVDSVKIESNITFSIQHLTLKRSTVKLWPYIH